MFVLGSSVILTTQVTSTDTPPVPVDATGAVTCIVVDPNGNETIYEGGEITHVSTGVYTVAIMGDVEGGWEYRFVADGQSASEGTFAVGTQFAQPPLPAPVTTYYAQPADLDLYIGNADYLPSVAAKAALIRQAEDDLDDFTAAQQNTNINGRKYTPWDTSIMTPIQVSDLTAACVAQAKYRLVMGQEFFEEARGATITGPDYTASRIPRLAPMAKRALIRNQILPITARGAA
jgi:hypothetical protein